MRTLLSTFIICFAITAFAQNVDANGNEIAADDEVFRVVEQMPEFPGGDAELMKFLSSIKYPNKAKEDDIQGTVYLKFIVNKDGSVSDITIARSSQSEILDNAAIAHLSTMPNWKPGIQDGKPVRVIYVTPIAFKLNSGTVPAKKPKGK